MVKMMMKMKMVVLSEYDTKKYIEHKRKKLGGLRVAFETKLMMRMMILVVVVAVQRWTMIENKMSTPLAGN